MNEHDADDYLTMYLEDTDEQLDALQETLSAWGDSPIDQHHRESMRLLHAMEGAAGAMKFEGVRALTRHLDRSLERARHAIQPAQQVDVGSLQRGVQFLRDCNQRLRNGETLENPATLLEQLAAAMDPVEG